MVTVEGSGGIDILPKLFVYSSPENMPACINRRETLQYVAVRSVTPWSGNHYFTLYVCVYQVFAFILHLHSYE